MSGLNIRNLSPSVVELFKLMAQSRGKTHAQYLTELVAIEASAQGAKLMIDLQARMASFSEEMAVQCMET